MVNNEAPWLTDISKRDDFKEITSKGGRVKSVKKTLAAKERASIVAKCKNCSIDCSFKSMCLKKDPESRCLVPKLRSSAIINETRVCSIDDDDVKMYMDNILGLYMEQCLEADSNEIEPKKIERERMRRLNTMFKRLKEFKELWSPPVQKNVNVNVTTNFDKMKERFEKHKDDIVMEVKDGE